LDGAEIEAAKEADCRNMGIASLKGAEHFRVLNYLYCDVTNGPGGIWAGATLYTVSLFPKSADRTGCN